MKIEDITAPPPRLAPEMRAAALQRTIEAGLATDRTWLELIEVSLELHRHREACSAFERLRGASSRNRALSKLHAHRLMLDVAFESHGSPREDVRIRAARPAAAVEAREASTAERVSEAFQSLFVDHMPLTLLVAMVTFPLVIGLGGFVAAKTGLAYLLPAIALIPALSASALVLAMMRLILIDAARGLADPPDVPAARPLANEAGRFAASVAIVAVLFLGPGVAGIILSEYVAGSVALIIGSALAPLALARHVAHGGAGALHPIQLVRTLIERPRQYGLTIASIAALFAPAGLAALLTLSAETYIMLAVTGPCLVAPALMAARLIGQLLHDADRDEQASAAHGSPKATAAPKTLGKLRNDMNAESLSEKLGLARKPKTTFVRNGVVVERTQKEEAPAAPAARARRPEQRAAPSPAARPQANRATAAAQKPPAPKAPAPRASAPRTPAPKAPAPKAPLAQRPSASQRPQPKAPAPQLRRPSAPRSQSARLAAALGGGNAEPNERRSPAKPRMAARVETVAAGAPDGSIPDLTKLPGASIVSGAARVAAGAAARPGR